MKFNDAKVLIVNAPDQTSKRLSASAGGMVCQICKDFDALAVDATGYECIVLYLDQPILQWKRWVYQDLARRLMPNGELILTGNPFLGGATKTIFANWKAQIKAGLWQISSVMKSTLLSKRLKQACGVELASDYGLIEIDPSRSTLLSKLGSVHVNCMVLRNETGGDNDIAGGIEVQVQNYFGEWLVGGKVPIDYDRFKVVGAEVLLRGKDAGNVLVLSPHPDDELIGCGGTLLGLARNGAQIHVVQMTEGATCKALKPCSEGARRQLRVDEARSVAERFGFELTCWPTGTDFALENTPQTRARLSSLLAELAPQIVFVPSATDRHPEHRLAYEIFMEVFHGSDLVADVYQYPVWGFLQPDIGVGVANDYDAVLEALYLYKVAMKAEDYVSRCRALACYHSGRLNQSSGPVEVFSQVQKSV